MKWVLGEELSCSRGKKKRDAAGCGYRTYRSIEVSICNWVPELLKRNFLVRDKIQKRMLPRKPRDLGVGMIGKDEAFKRPPKGDCKCFQPLMDKKVDICASCNRV